jgi:hypothetical protein
VRGDALRNNAAWPPTTPLQLWLLALHVGKCLPRLTQPQQERTAAAAAAVLVVVVG